MDHMRWRTVDGRGPLTSIQRAEECQWSRDMSSHAPDVLPTPWRLLAGRAECFQGTPPSSTATPDERDSDSSFTHGTDASHSSSTLFAKPGFVGYASSGSSDPGRSNVQLKPAGKDNAPVLEIGKDDVRFVMLQNIPCRCGHDEVLAAISEMGFEQDYNFFHLPSIGTRNIGYAFLGFNDMHVTARFAKAMAGYRFHGRNSKKSCAVVPAKNQDFDVNVMQNVDNVKYRKVLHMSL